MLNAHSNKRYLKLSVTKLIEYQQTYTAPDTNGSNPYANLREDKFYLFNGAFFKWDKPNNKWVAAEASVYEYIDYLTGVEHEWSQSENKWTAKPQPQNNGYFSSLKL